MRLALQKRMCVRTRANKKETSYKPGGYGFAWEMAAFENKSERPFLGEKEDRGGVKKGNRRQSKHRTDPYVLVWSPSNTTHICRPQKKK